MHDTVKAPSPAKGIQKPPKEYIFDWRGTDAYGKLIDGDIRAPSQAFAKAQLARQGIRTQRVQKRKVERRNTTI